nr:PREDICTED: trace amine-associated receptor 13c-like [Lepisosteus oculatus]
MELTELEPQTVQYCFPSKNGSCTKELRSTAVSIILYVSMFAVVILTLCGNLIVIISISHLKQLHTPTNLLVLSLAVADLLVGVFVMPFDMVKLIESCWVFGNLFCSFRNVFGFLLTSVSISSLIFIAIDRYFAVFYPFLYSSKITLNIALFCIVLSWLSSLCYNLSLFYFNGNSNDENLNTCLGDCFMLINSTWGIIDLLVTFILPCSVMIILYAKIFVAAKKQAHAINSITNQITFSNETNRKTSQKSEWKAAKTLGIVFPWARPGKFACGCDAQASTRVHQQADCGQEVEIRLQICTSADDFLGPVYGTSPYSALTAHTSLVSREDTRDEHAPCSAWRQIRLMDDYPVWEYPA